MPMHRAFGSWVMIRVVCSLIPALAGAEPRLFCPRRQTRQRVALGEFDINNNNNVNAVHFRPSVQSNPSYSPRLPFRVFEHLQTTTHRVLDGHTKRRRPPKSSEREAYLALTRL
jgi:hypothetical protein